MARQFDNVRIGLTVQPGRNAFRTGSALILIKAKACCILQLKPQDATTR